MDGHSLFKCPVPSFSPRKATSQEWERWKQTLEFYFVAEKITDAKVKQAKLLLLGGPEVQEIFFLLDKVTDYPPGQDAYSHTIASLDAKIGSKSTKWYERYVLSQLRQGKDETISAFLTRIRKQVQSCSFSDAFVNEAILGQFINGVVSNELRSRLMEKDVMTLETAEQLARTFETVVSQSGVISSSQVPSSSVTVNPTSTSVCRTKEESKGRKWNKRFVAKPTSIPGDKNSKSSPYTGKVTCYCCGQDGHKAKDNKCPALKAVCSKCRKTGHFAKVCNSSNIHALEKTSTATVKNVCSVSDENIFQVRDSHSADVGKLEEIVPCKFGGIPLSAFIDSGALFTMISQKTWNKLRRDGAQFLEYVPNPDVNFYDGSGSVKYSVCHTVRLEIECNNLKHLTEIIVVSEDLQSLLGRNDAKKLNVLRVGLSACKDVRIKAVFPGSTPLGKLKDFQLHIPIDPNVPPCIQPLRRVPFSLRSRIEEKINELLQLDVIEKVEGASRWVSPIVPVPQSANSIRLCVDLRRGNEAVLNEKHPLPTIEDVAPMLKGAKVFSKIDLRQAYHQIELTPESREITTFSTHMGLFRYKRLMFGLKCAPEMFQRILENVLSGLQGVFNYQDDLLVFGPTVAEHDANLEAVLRRLYDVGLVINPQKSRFRQKDVSFLGHLISEDSLRPSLDKVKAIKEFRSPETTEELRSFLGLVTYVGKFIPNLSAELDFLQRVARTIPFQWGPEAEQNFVHVQSLLSEESHLGFFDPDLPTTVMADASPVGLGAVLLQHKGTENRVICYISRSLSAVERRYSQTEKEALALVFAVERLRIYLIGRPFELVTDHKPLQTIFGSRSRPCARLERWILRLQGFQYNVRYAPGKNNIADPLSRLLEIDNSVVTVNDMYERNLLMFVNQLTPRAITLNSIREASRNDPELSHVCDDVRAGRDVKIKPFSILSQELCVVDGVLLRGSRIVVPALLREAVLKNAHEGHPGIVKMKDRLRSKVWWPGLDVDAEKHVRSCDLCQKIGKNITIEQMSRRSLPDAPWQHIAMDFKSLPSGEQACVVVDYFSRFPEVKVMKKTTANDTIRYLRQLFARYGLPSSITSDNGPQFTAKEFKEFCDTNGIQHYTSEPYWAQANGGVERFNKNLQKIIEIWSLKNPKDWENELLDYLLMYRTTAHAVTGKSPSELFFSRKLRDKLPSILEKVHEQDVRDRDAFMKANSIHERKVVPLKPIDVGDEVLIKRPFTKNKSDSKFETETGVVISANGPTVAVQTPTKVVHRHKNHVEEFIRPEEPTPLDAPVDVPPERPTRISKPPKWLNDFVV